MLEFFDDFVSFLPPIQRLGDIVSEENKKSVFLSFCISKNWKKGFFSIRTLEAIRVESTVATFGCLVKINKKVKMNDSSSILLPFLSLRGSKQISYSIYGNLLYYNVVGFQ